MLRVPLVASTGRPGYWLELLVALVVVAVAQRRLGPSSSATTSTTERALPFSAVQVRCWSRPTTTTRLPFARDCAACSALVAPHDHGEERGLLLPAVRHGHPEHGPGDPCLGVADLGLVGEVAGEADACLGHDASLLDCLAGRSALPLDPGDGGRRGMPRDRQGQAMEPTKSAMRSRMPTCGRLRCRVGWWSACGWGLGMPGTVRPDPSTLGVVGERGSRREGRSPARARQAPELGLRASGSSQGQILSRAPD
jgi:hypothetical protein